MTEKRFNYHHDRFGVYYLCDKEKGAYKNGIIGEIWADKSDIIDLVKLLNEQHETIEELQSELRFAKVEKEKLQDNIHITKAELSKNVLHLEEDLQYYKTKCASLEEGYLKLQRENKQLKDQIDVLEDDNEKYHKSLEQLNLYTRRFIPTKCTNEFKDCKTNRYYWLDHEGNFEGCLELLNLLDCENELLKSENRQLKGELMKYEEQIKGDEYD